MKKNNGFTLIELMIVIAIIAILMSYAIPAYRDYTVRTKVGEGIQLASGLKAYISEAWVSSDNLTNYNSGTNGVPASGSVVGKYVNQIQVTSGVIQVSYFNDPELIGQTVTLTPLEPGSANNSGSSLLWECTSSMAARFIPQGCR